MIKWNFFKLFFGLCVFIFALVMNVKHAVNDHGIKRDAFSLILKNVESMAESEGGSGKKLCKTTAILGGSQSYNCGYGGIKEFYIGDFYTCEKGKNYTGTTCKNGFRGNHTNCTGNTVYLDQVSEWSCN